MKKIIATIAGLLLTGTQIQAQDLSVLGGIQLSKLAFKNINEEVYTIERNGLRPSVHLGFQFGIKVSDKLTIVPGLEITSKGGKTRYKAVTSEDNTTTDEKYKISYLEIPVLLRYHIPISEKSNIHLSTGPYLGIGLEARVLHKSANEYGSDEYNLRLPMGNNELSVFKRIDGGWRIEAGYEIKQVLFRSFYSAGILNIASINSEHAKARNHTIGFSVGYKFDFEKKK